METKVIELKNILSKITNKTYKAENNISKAQLIQLEKEIECELPIKFKNFLEIASHKFPFFDYELLDFDGIRDNWRVLKNMLEEGEFEDATPWYLDNNQKIQNCWWNKSWLPFATDQEDNFLCLDLAPLPKGNYGQVFYWQSIGGAHVPKSNTFDEFLSWYTSELKNGRYYFDRESNIIEEIFDEKQFLVNVG